MPIYVYKCPKCGCVEEYFRSIESRLERVVCLLCHKDMELQMRAPAFKITENMGERLNRNYEKRKEKKASGEW